MLLRQPHFSFRAERRHHHLHRLLPVRVYPRIFPPWAIDIASLRETIPH
jgi:hypothetical protein